jgi:hypothetical protein
VGEGADPEFPFGVSRRRLAARSPSPGHGPPLVGSACPTEWSPNRVAGFWLPAPPMSSARERAGLRGLSRPDYPTLPRAPGPLMGFGSPTGYPTSRSGRPVSGPAPPMGFVAPTTDTARRSGSPGLASPGTFRPQGFDPLAGLLPARDTDPKIGCRPWGSPFRAWHPPTSRTRFRAVALMPFSALPAFSSEDEKVGSSVATPGHCSGRRAVPFREVKPPFRAEALVGLRPLRSSRPAATASASRDLPSCAFSPEAARPPTTPALQGFNRGEVRRTLASPPAPLRSAASPVRSRFRRCWFEPR